MYRSKIAIFIAIAKDLGYFLLFLLSVSAYSEPWRYMTEVCAAGMDGAVRGPDDAVPVDTAGAGYSYGYKKG